MKENRDKIYLERILEAAEEAEKYIKGLAFEDFDGDKKTYNATLMQIEVIGEMIARLSENFKEEHSDLPWHKAIGMRNQIAHGYFEINAKEVWKTAKKDLPELKEQVKKLI